MRNFIEKLSESALRILAELEEAGEENPIALLNTVSSKKGTREELMNLVEGLIALVHEDLVRFSFERDGNGSLMEASLERSLSGITALSNYVQFDSERSMWSDSRRSGPPYTEMFPHVLYTEKGNALAQEILAKKGYKWWRATE